MVVGHSCAEEMGLAKKRLENEFEHLGHGGAGLLNAILAH